MHGDDSAPSGTTPPPAGSPHSGTGIHFRSDLSFCRLIDLLQVLDLQRQQLHVRRNATTVVPRQQDPLPTPRSSTWSPFCRCLACADNSSILHGTTPLQSRLPVASVSLHSTCHIINPGRPSACMTCSDSSMRYGRNAPTLSPVGPHYSARPVILQPRLPRGDSSTLHGTAVLPSRPPLTYISSLDLSCSNPGWPTCMHVRRRQQHSVRHDSTMFLPNTHVIVPFDLPLLVFRSSHLQRAIDTCILRANRLVLLNSPHP